MAKRKSGQTGQGYNPHNSWDDIMSIIGERMSETMAQIKAAYSPKELCFCDPFYCPACCKNFLKEQVGTVSNAISGQYCEEESLAICYMLCSDCSQVLAYGDTRQQSEQGSTIKENMLKTWHDSRNVQHLANFKKTSM